MFYIWMLRRVLKMPVAGLLIDAVQVQVGASRFHRATFDVSESMIDEWLAVFHMDIHRAEEFNEKGHWPQQFSACGMYGGCEFRGICSTTPEAREAKILEYFKVQERKT